MAAEIVRHVVETPNQYKRTPLVDNSLDVGAPMILSPGKYMRHIPSGRIYPFEANGAKREDVELFSHREDGTNVKINKPPKQKNHGPFRRDELSRNGFDVPGANVVIINDNTLESPE